jgi:excisionase family DNA binding protein
LEAEVQELAKVLITVNELCAYLGISRPTYYRYAKAGRLPKPIKLGPGCRRFDRREVDAMIARLAEEGR